MPGGTFRRVYYKPTMGAKTMSKRTAAAVKIQRRVRKNSTAQLAKKAYSLAKYNNKLARGSYQTNLHKQAAPIKVSMFRPVAFHVPTPRDGEAIWQFGPITGGTYAATAVTSFTKPSVQDLTGGTGTAIHNMWDDANDDVFNGKYMLQSLNYTFTVYSTATQAQNIRFRVDFVKPRMQRQFRSIPGGSAAADSRNFRLPDALGAWNGILGQNNRVNPMYWQQVRKPYFFNVNVGRVTQGSGGNLLKPSINAVQKHIKLNINKVYNPRDIGTTTQDENSAYLSIPDNQHIWCIVSSDFELGPSAEADRPDVLVTRQFSWRDRAGHAA